MQGALPGVTILSRPGNLRNDRGTPNIRGRGNLGSSSPLFVIDGVIASQTDFNSINPNDVENLTVLKDASAAIYGSRAAYGVILVTTKKGRGGKVSIGYNGWSGYQMATYLPKTVGAVDFMTLRNEAASNAGKTVYYSAEEIEKAKSGLYPDLYPDTDWYKLVYRKAAPMMEYVVNFTGGGKTKYYLSLGYLNQESLVPGKNLDRYTARANTSTTVSKALTINSNLSFTKENIYSGSADDVTVSLARMTPTMVPVQSNGN
ncbi:TonB-dependent receptor plug domain-containing protein [Elizabethkingia sp. JS20170427COW]|uniref:TonB-dependent receptor plug domain-containing protein n=1 Tax=Elizabethkingia sp. JS20170427COW TaxID=2583851 RepID=UPI002105CCFE|nr:TonB-dependent receptor plug domain-containing protein [Elizabethkingia sp. JS20170427COW]